MDRKMLERELDLLRGNICRMCVTDDEIELINMQQWCKRRVDKIFSLNRDRIREKERPDS